MQRPYNTPYLKTSIAALAKHLQNPRALYLHASISARLQCIFRAHTSLCLHVATRGLNFQSSVLSCLHISSYCISSALPELYFPFYNYPLLYHDKSFLFPWVSSNLILLLQYQLSPEYPYHIQNIRLGLQLAIASRACLILQPKLSNCFLTLLLPPGLDYCCVQTRRSLQSLHAS